MKKILIKNLLIICFFLIAGNSILKAQTFDATFSVVGGNQLQMVLNSPASFQFYEGYNNAGGVTIVIKNVYNSQPAGTVGTASGISFTGSQSGTTIQMGSFNASFGPFVTATDEQITFNYSAAFVTGDIITFPAGTAIQNPGNYSASQTFNSGPYTAVIPNNAFNGVAATMISACTAPNLPTVSASPSTICPGASSTLSWTGNLNDATQWVIYTGSCGGTLLGTTTTNSFTVSPSSPSTTYFVRGEGGCVTPGSCGPVAVSVSDAVNPTITCPGNQTESPNASCQFTLPDYTGLASASDNCAGSPTITQSPNSGTVVTGNTTITLTANDGNGNTAQCIFDVLLTDATPPIAVCQNINVFLNGAGLASIVAADIDAGSIDNCSAVTLSASTTAFTCSDIGPNNVTLTVTDGSGNTSTCTSTVTIVDTISPVAVCQNINAYLDGAGNVTIFDSDLDAGSVDNCGGVSFITSQSNFTCSNIGPNNVTLTATDGSANSSSCTAIVTVLDTISPVITCPGNQTESPNISCQFTLPNYTGLATASDNCGASPTLSQSPTSGSVISGNTTITLTASDGSGNSSSCIFDVLLIDNTAPVAICQNINAYLDVTGSVSVTAADVDAGSSDNCGSVSLSLNQTNFSCNDIGPNNVTLIVNDGNGNTASCSATVTVLDTITSVNNCNGTLIWTGNSSSDWTDPNNWNIGLVPTASDVVVIPDVSLASGNNPTISSAEILGDIDIQAGGELSINSGGVLTLGTGNTLTINGSLVLDADASGTGILDDFTNSGTTILGSITARQLISSGSGLGQRYIGTPVLNGVAQGLDPTYTGYPLGQLQVDDCATDLLFTTSPYSNLLEWNENTVSTCDLEGWEAISAGSNLQNARGYSAWVQDGSFIEFTGTPNTGAVSYAGLGNSASGVADADGWHLLANPYPSPIDLSEVITLNGANFMNYIYYEGSSGPYLGTYQPFLPGDNLAMMQGFTAQTMSINTFVLDNTVRINSNTPFKSNEDWYEAKLEISVGGNGFADKTYLYFNEDASANFDYQWDCVKRTSENNQPTLYTGLSSEKLALNGRNITSLGESIPLGLNSGTTGEFELSFTGLETFPENINIYIEDKANNTFHLLSEGAYGFMSNSTTFEDRFEVHFEKTEELTAIGELNAANIDLNIFPNPTNGMITISSENLTNIELEVYNIYGKLVRRQYSSKNSIQVDLRNEAKGVYLISVLNNQNKITRKILVK